MTREQLFAWAASPKPFDDQVWVGRDISVADVKAAVRELMGAEADELEFMETFRRLGGLPPLKGTIG